MLISWNCLHWPASVSTPWEVLPSLCVSTLLYVPGRRIRFRAKLTRALSRLQQTHPDWQRSTALTVYRQTAKNASAGAQAVILGTPGPHLPAVLSQGSACSVAAGLPKRLLTAADAVPAPIRKGGNSGCPGRWLSDMIEPPAFPRLSLLAAPL